MRKTIIVAAAACAATVAALGVGCTTTTKIIVATPTIQASRTLSVITPQVTSQPTHTPRLPPVIKATPTVSRRVPAGGTRALAECISLPTSRQQYQCACIAEAIAQETGNYDVAIRQMIAFGDAGAEGAKAMANKYPATLNC